ncbi:MULTISPECIES: hypothetical protein [Vibrio]|uniref:Uncharacterized protein n=2 Tax=Vibrio TaxID=662 RepID=A0A510IEP1_9VIBR|nr:MULTISPECIES: hypothetical protein [Vibrio]RTZ20318.1 hypothetical protein EKN09_24555 [Vibrio penaeicida]BBL92242.1 hypothetical protein VroAM7_48950 [Vibrio rotiferianus]GLQ71143.1 hypothetical protein GCM10007932_05030 [Vibrio penaeicida]
MTMTSAEVSLLISSAYTRDRNKPQLVAFKEILRTSRKYGFPIVYALSDKSKDEQIRLGAKMLLSVSKSWPLEDVPDNLDVNLGSNLYNDAEFLINIALSNTKG